MRGGVGCFAMNYVCKYDFYDLQGLSIGIGIIQLGSAQHFSVSLLGVISILVLICI